MEPHIETEMRLLFCSRSSTQLYKTGKNAQYLWAIHRDRWTCLYKLLRQTEGEESRGSTSGLFTFEQMKEATGVYIPIYLTTSINGYERWRINKTLLFSCSHPGVVWIFRAEKAQPMFNQASPVVMETIGSGFVTTDDPGVEFIFRTLLYLKEKQTG